MNRLGIGTLVGSWLWAALALAQDTGDRATSFQAVSGAVHEDVPGGTLLVAAYGVVLAVLVLYVVYLTMMQQGARKDLARLEQVLAGKRAPEGDAKKD
jgi:hypothetical protein